MLRMWTRNRRNLAPALILALMGSLCANTRSAPGGAAATDQVLTTSERDMEGDGSADRISVVMKSGKRYDDTELWAGSGKKFEGTFAVRIEFGDGFVAETGLNRYLAEGDPVFFWDAPWKIQFADYNGDGRPDFNLGTFGTSNGWVYSLFTVDEKRSIVPLKIAGSTGLFIQDRANSTAKIQVTKEGISSEYYDNVEGRMVKEAYRWDAAAGRFVPVE